MGATRDGGPVRPRPRPLWVEVHDGDPRLAGGLAVRPGDGHHAPDPWQEHGRGLLIGALSSGCGHRPTARGKAVWFTLPARAVTV